MCRATSCEAAYIGENVEIGPGRVVLEPRTLAKMLDALDIQPGEMVLDLGCGLGYSAAVIARLADTVVAVEEDADLAAEAQRALSEEGVDNAVVVAGPLTEGAARHGPYDVITIRGRHRRVARGTGGAVERRRSHRGGLHGGGPGHGEDRAQARRPDHLALCRSTPRHRCWQALPAVASFCDAALIVMAAVTPRRRQDRPRTSARRAGERQEGRRCAMASGSYGNGLMAAQSQARAETLTDALIAAYGTPTCWTRTAPSCARRTKMWRWRCPR